MSLSSSETGSGSANEKGESEIDGVQDGVHGVPGWWEPQRVMTLRSRLANVRLGGGILIDLRYLK